MARGLRPCKRRQTNHASESRGVLVDDRKTTGSLCDDVTGVRRAREMRGETKEGRRAIGDLKKYLR